MAGPASCVRGMAASGRDGWVRYALAGAVLRGVIPVFIQAGKDLFRDSAADWAAMIAYYSLLSLFPLLLAAASIASYLGDSRWALDRLTDLLGLFAPNAQDVGSAVGDALDSPGRTGVVSILVLLWAGSRVFGALTKALNLVWGVEEAYPFARQRLVELLMLLSVGACFALALASRTLIEPVWAALRPGSAGTGLALTVARVLLPVPLLLAAYFLTYRFVPRARVDPRAALSGAVVATALFLLARPLFLGYAVAMGSGSAYGPLWTAVVLLVWAWIVALITLFGGSLAAHIQQMLLEGRPAAAIGRVHEAHLSPGRASGSAGD